MKNILKLFLRYFVLILLSIKNLFLIYLIATPITLFLSYTLISIFHSAVLQNNLIIIGNKTLEIIPACVAGAGIYLLLILNLSTPMETKKRIYSLVYSIGIFITLNIIRIFILSILFLNSFSFYSLTHKVFWYGLSIVFVVAIWFSEVKLFKIKTIPFYTDILYLKSLIKN